MLCEKVVCVYFAHARLFIDRESFSWNFLFEECGPDFKRSRKGFHILSNGAPRIAFTAQHYVTRNVATWCQLRRRKLDLTTWFCHQFVKSGIKKTGETLNCHFNEFTRVAHHGCFSLGSARCVVASAQMLLLLCLQLVWSRFAYCFLSVKLVAPCQAKENQ